MINRRQVIKHAMIGLAAMPVATQLAGCSMLTGPGRKLGDALIPTQYDNNLKATIPVGASLRLVAKSGEFALPKSSYRWHGAPDGGACFKTERGGWVYVSNSELPDNQGGGLVL